MIRRSAASSVSLAPAFSRPPDLVELRTELCRVSPSAGMVSGKPNAEVCRIGEVPLALGAVRGHSLSRGDKPTFHHISLTNLPTSSNSDSYESYLWITGVLSLTAAMLLGILYPRLPNAENSILRLAWSYTLVLKGISALLYFGAAFVGYGDSVWELGRVYMLGALLSLLPMLWFAHRASRASLTHAFFLSFIIGGLTLPDFPATLTIYFRMAVATSWEHPCSLVAGQLRRAGPLFPQVCRWCGSGTGRAGLPASACSPRYCFSGSSCRRASCILLLIPAATGCHLPCPRAPARRPGWI